MLLAGDIKQVTDPSEDRVTQAFKIIFSFLDQSGLAKLTRQPCYRYIAMDSKLVPLIVMSLSDGRHYIHVFCRDLGASHSNLA